MLGVNESVFMLTQIRCRQQPIDVAEDPASELPSRPRRRPLAWLCKMGYSVTRRTHSPAFETGEAARETLTGAHPGLRG
jgi:hypothetical protein